MSLLHGAAVYTGSIAERTEQLERELAALRQQQRILNPSAVIDYYFLGCRAAIAADANVSLCLLVSISVAPAPLTQVEEPNGHRPNSDIDLPEHGLELFLDWQRRREHGSAYDELFKAGHNFQWATGSFAISSISPAARRSI